MAASNTHLRGQQYPVDEWHRRTSGGAHAESVTDRIVHNAVRMQMGDVNMWRRTLGSRA